MKNATSIIRLQNGDNKSKVGWMIISDVQFVTLTYALAYAMMTVAVIGVVTNAINIRTFVSMGLEDGITVSLAGLAMSDFGFTFFGCVLSTSNVIAAIEDKTGIENLPINPKGIFSMFSANLGYLCYQVTCMITTFMAVARCMCVAMPFQFKNFFTRVKSIWAMIGFVLIAMASYIPLLSQMGAQWGFDPVVNKSRIVLWLSGKRSDFKDVISFVHFVVFVFVSSFVVIVCVVVMAKHLRMSGKFRHDVSASGRNKAASGKGQQKDTTTSGYKLSGKELQVVRQVVVICTIYTVCMLPTLCVGVYRLLDPDFDVGRGLNNLYYILCDAQIILELVNSATTFPVYYAYNTKFRSHCLSQKGRSRCAAACIQKPN